MSKLSLSNNITGRKNVYLLSCLTSCLLIKTSASYSNKQRLPHAWHPRSGGFKNPPRGVGFLKNFRFRGGFLVEEMWDFLSKTRCRGDFYRNLNLFYEFSLKFYSFLFGFVTFGLISAHRVCEVTIRGLKHVSETKMNQNWVKFFSKNPRVSPGDVGFFGKSAWVVATPRGVSTRGAISIYDWWQTSMQR